MSRYPTWRYIAYALPFALCVFLLAWVGTPGRTSYGGVLQPNLLHKHCSRTGQRIVLVTGAAGFIGFHSSLALRLRNYTVVGVDNLNNYYPVSLKYERAAELQANGVYILRADINDFEIMFRLTQICNFSHVLHLAAQAGVRYAAKNPLSYVDSNIRGTVNLLEVMRHLSPIPPLVYASSSSVYGNSKRLPFSEMDKANLPASLYAASKRSQELITQAYHGMFGVPAIGLRFFTVYGPSGRPDMSVMSFTNKILNRKPIIVFKQPNGDDLARDFTYIDDVVNGILGAIDRASPGAMPQPRHLLFNLGNTKVVGVSKMLSILEQQLGQKAIIEEFAPSIGEVIRTNANISAARLELGYDPQVDIATGLRKFVSWFLSLKRDSAVFADLVHYCPD